MGIFHKRWRKLHFLTAMSGVFGSKNQQQSDTSSLFPHSSQLQKQESCPPAGREAIQVTLSTPAGESWPPKINALRSASYATSHVNQMSKTAVSSD